MNDKRISLSRILAVNWYGFRQIIDVSGHTLVAGAFGTGKTALLDLVQYVVLGSHWRPNRAAAGNARSRSLVSYCLCDTNTRQNGEPHYTRQSGVTLAALEFTWPQDEAERRSGDPPRRETWGMRVQYSSPTADPRCTWFGVSDRMEWDAIAPGGIFLDEENFRTWIRREYGREAIFSRQVDYLAEMATAQHLYFEAEAFRRTLPKAIAFEPEENVEKFIREFVLEDSPLDVRDVRQSVAAYRETHSILANQKNEAEQLREVCAEHEALTRNTAEAAACHQVARRFQLDQHREREERATRDLALLRDETARDRADLEAVRSQLQETIRVIKATQLEVGADPQAVQLEKLKRRREELHFKIQRIEESRKSLRERLAAIRLRWNSWLKRGDDLALRDPLTQPLSEILKINPADIEALIDRDETKALAAHSRLSDAFDSAWRAAGGIRETIGRQIDSHRSRLQQLAQELDTLAQNHELGACPLFRALEEKMPGKVRQLGRLIEVREEADRWWPALEIYLGARRLILVVDTQNYRAALDILRRVPPGREPESLLNPWEAAKLPAAVQPDSLAGKVEIEDPLARNYVHHLLGEVICVESADELDQSPAGRTITPEGLFKQVPLRRRLLPEKEVPLTLGVRGRERLRTAREAESIEVRSTLDRLELLTGDFDSWLDSGKKSGFSASASADPEATSEHLAKLQSEWRVDGETIELLSTPEREARLTRLEQHEQSRNELLKKEGSLQTTLNQFSPKEKQLADTVTAATDRVKELEAELLRLRAALPASVTPEKLDTLHAEFLSTHKDWNSRAAAAEERGNEAGSKAAVARTSREAARRRLIDSAHIVTPEKRHPQYRTDFDPLDEENDRWATRLHALDDIEIPKYEGLAQERRIDWENRLRESVLDRLKEKLDGAEADIKSLRHYLSHSVGRYRYTITQRRDPAFLHIWKLLDTGFEPTDPLLAGAGGGGDPTAEAVDELLRAVEASGGEIDERARRLLDYRHYHHYDIEMLLKDDPNAPAISLGRSMRSLSGGENQAPFFISMLAAFRRVYDLGTGRSQHLGLVVMDEAFSKLSGDGVEDCLELAANFQLQLLMAFPIDRLGVMAPYADTVIICRKEEERDARGLITGIHNIPQIITAAEAMESLD